MKSLLSFVGIAFLAICILSVNLGQISVTYAFPDKKGNNDNAELNKAKEQIKKAIDVLNDKKSKDGAAKNHIDDAIKIVNMLPKKLADNAMVHLNKARSIVNSNGKDKTAVNHLEKALDALKN